MKYTFMDEIGKRMHKVHRGENKQAYIKEEVPEVCTSTCNQKPHNQESSSFQLAMSKCRPQRQLISKEYTYSESTMNENTNSVYCYL